MRILVFLTRVAIVCNLFFAACLLIRFQGLQPSRDAEGFIIVLGWLLAPVVNLVVNIWTAKALLAKNKEPLPPLWMRISNLIFLILQIVFLFLK